MRTVPVTHSDFVPLTSAQMPYPAITLAELEERSISLEESWSSYSNGYYVYGPNGNTIWFASTGKYKIETESGAVVVNYDAEGENACCVWSITDHYLLKQHNGNFLFFTQTDGPRMKSTPVSERLAKVHLVAENPNKK